MSENNSFTEKTLKKIRSGEKSETSRRKIRLSRVILVIDALLIVLIVFYFNSRDTGNIYKSSAFSYSECTFRLSITAEPDTDNYIFTLTAEPINGKGKTLYFSDSVARLQIVHGSRIILSRTMGESVTSITMGPGEVRTFVTVIKNEAIKQALPGTLSTQGPGRRTLFQFNSTGIPVTARVSINTPDPVSTDISFTFEAGQ